MTTLSISHLPSELLYAILSHSIADTLFDGLFIQPLLPTPSHGCWKTIQAVRGVSTLWRDVVERILAAVLVPSQSQSEEECRPSTTNTLREMQDLLSSFVRASIDGYRLEQHAVGPAGINTPTLPSTPPHSTQPLSLLPTPALTAVQSPLTLTTSITQTTRSVSSAETFEGLLHSLRSSNPDGDWRGSDWERVPIFQRALAYSQAAIWTCSTRSKAGKLPADAVHRPDLSTLAMSSSQVQNALNWVERPTAAFVRPREIGDVIERRTAIVSAGLEEALRVCRWNDLLEAVFLRGDRTDESMEALESTFDGLEAQADTVPLHHLLRSGLLKTVQTITRMEAIQGQTAAGGGGGDVCKSRAINLSFRWTGRVVFEWTGL